MAPRGCAAGFGVEEQFDEWIVTVDEWRDAGDLVGALLVAVLFATRQRSKDFRGLPELPVGGLGNDDARALLGSVVRGPLDERVRDRIVAETRGNPLALLELPRGLTPAELAGGFGLPDAPGLSGRIGENFRRQLEALPAETQRLLLVAAAEPVGEPVLLWRAAERLGIGVETATPAADAGLLEFGARVRFRIRWCARRPTRRRRRTTGAWCPARCGGHRPRGRSRSPRLASCPRDARPRGGRRRGARALGRPCGGTRGPCRGGRLPQASRSRRGRRGGPWPTALAPPPRARAAAAGYSYKEIADKLAVTYTNVNRHVTEGRAELRERRRAA
jgi:hypothetical protein